MLRACLYGVATLVVVVLLMATVGLVGPVEFGVAVLAAVGVGVAVARRRRGPVSADS